MAGTGRPLILSHPPTGAHVVLEAPAELAGLAEHSREAFSAWLGGQTGSPLLLQRRTEAAEDSADDDESGRPAPGGAEADVLLLAHYLLFLSTRPTDRALVPLALNHFHAHLLPGQPASDIHSAAAHHASSDEARRLVITAYYRARLSLPTPAPLPPLPVGRLWRNDEPHKKLVAVLGGQGVNETYWQELVNLHSLYAPILTPFLEAADAHLDALASSDHAHASALYKDHGIRILQWLSEPRTTPPTAYLATCAVSLPLIGLVQIAQYMVLGQAQGLTPDGLSSQLAGGVAGHSQGVVVAALIGGRLGAGKDSWPAFTGAAMHALGLLFHIGRESARAFPRTSLPPKLIAVSAETEGPPTPMLAVTGLPLDALLTAVARVSAEFAADFSDPRPDAQVSLFNGPKAFVVTGHPRTLLGLVSLLKKSKADPGLDQSKVPFSKRLPVFSMRFLPIGVPYHSHHLEGCVARILRPVAEGGIGAEESEWWESHRASLGCPVYNTETGADLRAEPGGLLQTLADLICTRPVHWAQACAFPEDTTHIIDLGLGTLSGIGSLMARTTEGKGHRMVFAGLPASGEGNKTMNEVYDAINITREEKWSQKYKIGLIKTADGRLQIDTPFSRLLSKPPLMVAGMTPCTVPADFNAAVMNAGYHVELAGGGHYNAKGLRAKIAAIQAKLEKPGLGFTLNALYINQKQWAFQFPLWLEMRKEGLPMEGFVVAAGIPSTEKAKEIVDGLREAGLKHVSFKPGSVDGIRQVVQIAAAHPDFPVICQWTGGRAGGHHSCEDFHQPLLATYASIRSQPNLVLVVGSGFGCAEDVYPYLTGAWSRDMFGVQPMPVDGILFASRMMVAKEAATSLAVKELIVQAQGVPDGQWEGTYDRETGGIITVTSELGEPIHKIATRGIKLWKEFDETVFALPRAKRAAWLKTHKEYVVRRLNADFQKPWFAEKDGQPAELGDMTYAETVDRLVRLMYVRHQSRWVDPTLRNLVGDWLRRIEERLSVVNGAPKISELQSYAELDCPSPTLQKFFARYPEARTQILASEDIVYFLSLCQRPGQKPVPFIPVLDADFGIWFKKDSLWQAEDIDAVFDQDPQRVAILQGPVAVRHSRTTEATAGAILRGIEAGLVSRLLVEEYGGDEGRVPRKDFLCPHVDGAANAHILQTATGKIACQVRAHATPGHTEHIYDIVGGLPPSLAWLETLASAGTAGREPSWLAALLRSQALVHGPEFRHNPLLSVLAPRPNQRVTVLTDQKGRPLNVKVFGGVPRPRLAPAAPLVAH